MSKKCIECGVELEDDARYCDECGAEQNMEKENVPLQMVRNQGK